MRRSFASLLLGVALISATAGCSGGAKKTVSSTEANASTEAATQDLMNTIEFLDPDLKADVSLPYPAGASRSGDGTLQAFAVLRNHTGKPVQVEGRVRFFNARRVPSDGPTGWKRVILPAHTTQVYEDHSTKRAEAAYYRIEIRRYRGPSP